ncbi:MAG: hypothetical protein ACM3NQ_08070 [Bacteroidales bacterium]
MIAGRLHIGPVGDLAVAALFLAATVLVAALILQELTTIRSPVPAAQPASSPAVVPADRTALSIAVTVLPLPDGQELRVGDPIEKMSRVLAKAVEVRGRLVETGRIGERVTRHYEYGPVSFSVVLEAFERNGVMRIASIYVE